MDVLSMLLNFIVYGATTLTNIFKEEQSNSPASGLNVTKVVMGGYNASIEDHPYQVFFSFGRRGRYSCGGFIVSERYIVTAAHCAIRTKASAIRLRAGSRWKLRGILIPIAEAISHPKYVPYDCDVAVLKTTDPIRFSKKIQPVKLPYKGKPVPDNAALVVAGWGKTGANTGTTNYLQAVVLPAVNDDECRQVFKKVLTDNMFCAGFYKSEMKSVCPGDSGGAILHDGEAVGIVSFGRGRGCVAPGFYHVFTKVSAPAVREFIEKHTGL